MEQRTKSAGSLLKALAIGSVPTAAGGYYLKKNPDAAAKFSQWMVGDDYDVTPNQSTWEKTKDVASSPNTWKYGLAAALAAALGYGAYNMGKSNQMGEIERAALGMR